GAHHYDGVAVAAADACFLSSLFQPMRPLPTSLLFPYTTLFRSVACDVNNPLCGPTGASAIFGPQKGATAEMVAALDNALAVFGTDRKSTRLNSSHVKISYAVFCLKKKTNPATTANATGNTATAK